MCPTEEQEVMDGRPPFRRRAHPAGEERLRRFARDPLIFRRAAGVFSGGGVSGFIGGRFGCERGGAGRK